MQHQETGGQSGQSQDFLSRVFEEIRESQEVEDEEISEEQLGTVNEANTREDNSTSDDGTEITIVQLNENVGNDDCEDNMNTSLADSSAETYWGPGSTPISPPASPLASLETQSVSPGELSPGQPTTELFCRFSL